MAHRRQKHHQPSRPAPSTPPGSPEAVLPTDVATLQAQLRLARALPVSHVLEWVEVLHETLDLLHTTLHALKAAPTKELLR
jgi:hypothetical protein